MKYNKKRIPREFKRAALKGDSILMRATNNIMQGNVPQDRYNRLLDKLVSNIFITEFQIPMTFKHHEITKKNNLGVRGDKVEAYIYWLYINYNIKAVERFLLKQYKRIINLQEYN